MAQSNFICRVVRFYIDGFRNMTVGRTLWTVIIVKVVIIFAVLKLFFFQDFIGQNASKGQEADFVSAELEERTAD